MFLDNKKKMQFAFKSVPYSQATRSNLNFYASKFSEKYLASEY